MKYCKTCGKWLTGCVALCHYCFINRIDEMKGRQKSTWYDFTVITGKKRKKAKACKRTKSERDEKGWPVLYAHYRPDILYPARSDRSLYE